MALRVLCLLAVIAVVSAQVQSSISISPLRKQFNQWMKEYNREYYSPAEEEARFQIFTENAKKIAKLNQENPSAEFGFNKFADMSSEEFKEQVLMNKKFGDKNMLREKVASAPVAPLYSQSVIDALPTTFDWRTQGAVTPVKDQGMCGSCWSFSTTGNIEGQWFIKNKKLVGLSEEQLVDCDHACSTWQQEHVCDSGCDGGLPWDAFSYVISNQGIDTEAAYPYTAGNGTNATCDASSDGPVGATITNWTMISTQESQMQAYLVQNGPISILADADRWQTYKRGILTDVFCGDQLDHAILIVGYAVGRDFWMKDVTYWIIKNSWGADWGEQGYIYLEMGKNLCGINEFPSSSIV